MGCPWVAQLHCIRMQKVLAKLLDPSLAFCIRLQKRLFGESATMAEIQLRNLSKRWGSFVGVENFDLTIADKEFLVLLGPSGCGKTTTMRMIAGLEDATEGDILIDGKRVNDLEPKDRDVAMVFQSYALYPNMSVYENIRFPLKVRGEIATADEKVRRAAAMVELDDFWTANRPPCQAGSDNEWHWPAPLYANPTCS